MKICAYVQESYAKANYKNECMDTRQFVGLRVIIDCLERAGIIVDGWMMIDTLWIIYIVTFATSFSLTLSVAIASGEELKKNRQ